MHFEVPKAKSFKEFGGEYLMIVISILTALALEHGVQAVHHHRLADEASVKIEAEMRANIAEIGKVLTHNEDRIKELSAVQKEMLANIRGKGGVDEWNDHFNRQWKQYLNLRIKSPTLLHEAWDAALANQAVGYLPQQDLERYSSLYGNLRDIQTLTTTGGMSFMDGPRWVDTVSNFQLGLAERENVYRMVNQMIAAYGSVDGNLDSFQKQLQAAVARNKKEH